VVWVICSVSLLLSVEHLGLDSSPVNSLSTDSLLLFEESSSFELEVASSSKKISGLSFKTVSTTFLDFTCLPSRGRGTSSLRSFKEHRHLNEKSRGSSPRGNDILFGNVVFCGSFIVFISIRKKLILLQRPFGSRPF